MAGAIESLLKDWERSRLGAQDYLEAMPEIGYRFRPVPEVLSFGGHFLHLAHANYVFAAAAGFVSPLSKEPAETNPDLESKDDTTRYTLASYDFMLAAIKTLPPTALGEEVTFFSRTISRAAAFAKALEHQVHHRGQAAVYLRLMGVKPPAERLFHTE